MLWKKNFHNILLFSLLIIFILLFLCCDCFHTSIVLNSGYSQVLGEVAERLNAAVLKAVES